MVSKEVKKMEEKKENKQAKQAPKNVGLIIFLVVLAGLGFVYFRAGQKSKINQPQTSQQVQTEKKQSGGVIESIRDAISKSISFKCQYQPEGSNQLVTIYFKSKNIRSEYAKGGEVENISVVKDNRVWAWQPKTKTGFVFSLNVVKQNNLPKNKSFDQEEMIKQAEKYRQNCRVENLSESLFKPPTEIQFQDMDELMKNTRQK